MEDDSSKKRPLSEGEEEAAAAEQVVVEPPAKRSRRNRKAQEESETVEDVSDPKKRLEAEKKAATKGARELFNIPDLNLKQQQVIKIPHPKLGVCKVVSRAKEIKHLAKELEVENLLGLAKDEGRQQAKYFVTGIQGCGKSTLVLEIVARLRKTRHARVIYLQDLKGPLDRELLDAMVHAFPDDEYILRRCEDALDEAGGVSRDKLTALYMEYPAFCFLRKWQSFLVVDDLPTYYDEFSGLADFVKPMVQLEGWTKWVTTIFVGRLPASILPDAFLGDVVHVKPSMEDASAKLLMKEVLGVQVDSRDFDEVKDFTGLVPGELDHLCDFIIKNEKGKKAVDFGLEDYYQDRYAKYCKDVDEYFKLVDGLGRAKPLAMAVLLMKLGLPVDPSMAYTVFDQIMFEDSSQVVSACSKPARKALLDTVQKNKAVLKAATADLEQLVLEHPRFYSDVVVAKVAKLVLLDFLMSKRELKVPVHFLSSNKKPVTWTFTDIQPLKTYKDIQDVVLPEGTGLYKHRFDNEGLVILKNEATTEDDPTPWGLFAVDVCLDVKKAAGSDFFTQVAPKWRKNKDLQIEEGNVYHLWVVPSVRRVEFKDKDRWNKAAEGVKPQHRFVLIKDLVKAYTEFKVLEKLQ